MTPAFERPDLAGDLLHRTAEARQYRHRLIRAQLPAAEMGRARHLDIANGNVLRRIVAEHGWPTRALVGEAGVWAVWEIALYADPMADFQRLALRLLTTAVEQGEATVQQWAHLHDRCETNADGCQTFGTQYRLGPHGPQLVPVESPDELDQRRESVRLRPHREALANLRRRLGWAPPDGPAHRLLSEPVPLLAGVSA
ncbi:DUF6624 domain-containing protein [Streptomyces jumonjinensis]|uniref:Uncharacterized protein n=1 Tax=Streptomyces jumonjinensis TaxID=1945 RepID=A0A646KTI4_STRJU|nr:DUF6624 domain-containing protein [Streptomyces jumonjinensis]MQT05418.1 hypothetical protein [Streptomyces jumonjinensis]